MARGTLALVLCLLAVAGGASARELHGRSLKGMVGTIIPGTGKANGYYLITGPTRGDEANAACESIGAELGLQPGTLGLANIAQLNEKPISQLIFNNLGYVAAWINTAPNFITPVNNGRPDQGPVGRNGLTITPVNSGNAFLYNPPNQASAPNSDFSEERASAAICGPNPNPPTLCTVSDPEFLGWAVSKSLTAAPGQCPTGFRLANVAANNLFKSDQKLSNPANLYDGTGFPDVRKLITNCTDGPVWANTAPGFTTPGTCVSVDAAGTKTGAKTKDNTSPLCAAVQPSLCFATGIVEGMPVGK